MKTLKYSILSVLFVIINITVNNNLQAQDLSKLPEAERNKKLIEIAREVYKAPRFKNFYREFGTPTITEMKTLEVSAEREKKIAENPNDMWHGSTVNQKFYMVYFPYDKDKETFEENYAAKVYIWENTGRAFGIGLGNRYIFSIPDGKVPDRDKEPEPFKRYNITYSKDVPDAAKLPKTGEWGDIITITLKTIIQEDETGWVTEYGYNFEEAKDLQGGMVISDEIKSLPYGSYNRIIKIRLLGEMKINVTSYREQYDSGVY